MTYNKLERIERILEKDVMEIENLKDEEGKFLDIDGIEEICKVLEVKYLSVGDILNKVSNTIKEINTNSDILRSQKDIK